MFFGHSSPSVMIVVIILLKSLSFDRWCVVEINILESEEEVIVSQK